MTTLSLARPRSRAVLLTGIVGFAVALALASQVAVPLPFTPVPVTLQPMLVVLAGLWLGPRAAAASTVLYLMAGAAGLPVFTPFGAPGLARLVGPTGGYLLAYPVAAAVTGLLADRARGMAPRIGAALAGMLVLYLGGLAQLAILTGSLQQAALLGALPFAALDAVKAVIAALLAPRSAAARARS
ncbi:MAG TPA: biotin transporter BioY [Gemmatimonadaceae bacterium]